MAARACYADSTAPTLMQIRSIFTVVLSFEVCTLCGIPPRVFGACVPARAGYADSNAPILIKIGGILTIVFVI